MDNAKVEHLRYVIQSYGDVIRATDLKSNISMIFATALVAQVLTIQSIPLSPPFRVAPLLCAVLFLILSIYPRYHRYGDDAFQVSSRPSEGLFGYVEDSSAYQQVLMHRCMSLSRILYYKTLYLKIGLVLIALYVLCLLVFSIYIGIFK